MKLPFSQDEFCVAKISDDKIQEHLSKIKQAETHTKLEQLSILSIQDVINQSGINPKDNRTLLIYSTTKGNIDILEIIKIEIVNLDRINKGPNGEKILQDFSLKDYTPLIEYTRSFGNDVNIIDFVTYGILDFWSNLSKADISKDLWGHNFEGFNFLEVCIDKLSKVIESYFELLIKGKRDEALSIFRNYIELVSILFASTIDYDFFKNYTTNTSNNVEYLKQWYKHLQPQKVVNKLNMLKEDASSKLDIYCIERFIGTQRDLLYEYTSSICHAKFSHLTNPDVKKEVEMLNLATDFLFNSSQIILIANFDYIKFESDKEISKFSITNKIWIEFLYKHLLRE